MAAIEDVEGVVGGLPDVSETVSWRHRTWQVAGKSFAWVRPFSKADIRRFGDAEPPTGPIVAVRTEDLHEKEAVLAAGTKGVFTIPHFDNFAAVLIQLDAIGKRNLGELLVDGWLAVAPEPLARDYLASKRRR